MRNVSSENQQALCSWSGGKDSCYALMLAIENGSAPMALMNVLNEGGERSRSHGLNREFLEAQAEAMLLPIEFIESTWQDYEENFIDKLKYCKAKYDLREAVYGDIDIQSHRDWEEKVSSSAGLKAILPLWERERVSLVREMIEIGIEAIIVSCNNHLGVEFLGRKIDEEIINEFESLGVDPCGENGEYHTAVVNCPLFSASIRYEIQAKRQHNHYCFLDITFKT